MNNQHIHASLIKLWADGVIIQKLYVSRFTIGRNFFSENNWLDDPNPNWDPKTKYRVKPSQDRKFIVHLHFSNGMPQINPHLPSNIQFIYDHQTGSIKDVEILK